MTLLELLVGLTVGAVVAGVGYGTFASVIDHRTKADAQAQTVIRAANARRLLTGWLSGARLLVQEAGPPFRGLDGVYDGVPDDELTFLTGVGSLGRPGETLVRLHIDRDTLTAERGLTAELSAWSSSAVERVQIEPHAVGLDARYLTHMLGSTEWLPSWISSSVLPVGIELEILGAVDDTMPPLLRLPIVVSIGSGR
jgi:prepilin-type N-terminal cleavage/methylation domain-containing protein